MCTGFAFCLKLFLKISNSLRSELLLSHYLFCTTLLKFAFPASFVNSLCSSCTQDIFWFSKKPKFMVWCGPTLSANAYSFALFPNSSPHRHTLSCNGCTHCLLAMLLVFLVWYKTWTDCVFQCFYVFPNFLTKYI